jgi:hypothetical protein
VVAGSAPAARGPRIVAQWRPPCVSDGPAITWRATSRSTRLSPDRTTAACQPPELGGVTCP